ncbi:MAG: TonB-dependent receptor, partial [Bacteroidetes bacterium]|nr:TonB-dependent receptor [Bacteroidota bacterium]
MKFAYKRCIRLLYRVYSDKGRVRNDDGAFKDANKKTSIGSFIHRSSSQTSLRGFFARSNLIVCLTSFFLFTYPTLSNAQDLNKKISINLKNVSLIDVINEISNIGQVNFSYSPQIIPADKKISVKAKNKTIKEILDASIKKNGLDYIIVENQIILKSQKEKQQQTTDIKPKDKIKYTISGYLKDITSGEILIGASVYAKGTILGTTTNAYGFYSLTLPENEYEIVFSFIGYKNIIQPYNLNENKNISVALELSNFEIKTVEVVANNQETEIHDKQLSEMKLSLQTIKSLPGFAGDIDIIKSLQAVPGIKAYGDGSTLFYVRGGNSDQNLILIDEAPIYNPSHLFGFFSAIAPDAIKDVTAYKGDFPASYGGRLSSVIDIKTKDGNMKKFGFSGSVGPFTSNVTFEGPVIKEKSSFFISGRRSNINWLFSKTLKKPITINFFDINSKLNFKFNDKNRLFFTFYKGNDDLSRNFTGSSVNTFGISWDNILGTLRWNHIFNDKLFSNTTFYTSRYNYYLYMSKEQNEYWNSSISNNTLKTDFTYFMNPKNTFKWGIELNSHSSNPGNVNFDDINTKKYVPEIPKYTSREFNFYISNEQKINNKITLRYGLRLPIWQNMGATTIYYYNVNYQVMDTAKIGEKSIYSTFFRPEPRCNISYSINKISELKASYSRTTQFIQVLSNSTSPFTSLEVWVPSGPNIKPQTADQYAMGYFRKILKSNFDFSTEIFYKQFHNQIDYADHANMLFNPLIEGELRFGKAWSYGVEFMLRKQKGKFYGWL